MSIQYLAPGFELTTFCLQVSSLNHQTRAPAPYSPILQNQTISYNGAFDSFFI